MSWKRLLIALLLGLGLATLVLFLYYSQPRFLELIELKAGDALFWLRGPKPLSSGKVAVVAVGERSLHEEGRWPWPRQKMAELIDGLAGLGAGAIGLDMGFFEPDQRLEESVVMAIAQAARAGQPISAEEIRQRFHPDHLLAQSLTRNAQVVLGYYFYMGDDPGAPSDKREARKLTRELAKFALPPTRYASPQAMERGPLLAVAPENNQPILNNAASSAGFFNIIPDSDGVVRRIPLVIQCGDRSFPSLALATLSRYLHAPLTSIRVEDFGLERIQLGDLSLPVDEKGLLRINFREGLESLPIIEASDVLRGKVQRQQIEGKALLVAVTAAGVFDMRTTPLASLEPGGYIQAQVIDNLLSGDFLERPGWSRIFDLGAMLALGACATVFCGFLPLVAGWLLTVSLGVGYVWSTYYFFLQGHPLGLVYPLLALASTGLGLTVYRNLTEVKDKHRLRLAFQQYLNPSVIERILKEPGALTLGGERKELTVLVSDIRGFTSISEKLPPEQLSNLLNAYMDQMTAEVFAQEGLLDKYIGDAIMAVFGAPAPQPDHAQRACRTALGMVKRAAVLSKEWEKSGLPSLRIGLGINSGAMVVGNMGSHRRFNYTVIGDNVNLAFRAEALCKVYGADIITCQTTRDLCQQDFLFRILDFVQVKGKKEPVAIYELLGEKPEGMAPTFPSIAEEAFALYLARDFQAAAEKWNALLKQKPGDAPTLLMLERCERYEDTPPGPEWTGVEVRSEK